MVHGSTRYFPLKQRAILEACLQACNVKSMQNEDRLALNGFALFIGALVLITLITWGLTL